VKRSDTLISVIVTTLQIAIIFILFLMILSELGTNITAILTGAGVLGIAIGFGAQSLVKDVIAGLFIIMENQYRKGDVVKIAGTSGVVEEINLRRTILRDLDGIAHVIPNGEIRVASNFTKVWSRVNLNISVSYGTDLDKAMEVINEVGKELASDPKWAPDILTPPKVLRVDNLGSSGIDIKILGETKPIRQWDVMGELRLRLKRAFDREGIEIPWPHTKVYFGNLPEMIVSDKDNRNKYKSTKDEHIIGSLNN
jgi:moderate conductance mechanosensitive channel